MKLQLPYCYSTESTDGTKGRLSFPPYVISQSNVDDSLTDTQLAVFLTSTLNKFGNKVRDMQIDRSNDKVTVTCYSDYFPRHPGEKWTIVMEDASCNPIRWE